MTNKNKQVATIALYGNHDVGAGWLIAYDGYMMGTGEPKAGRGFTEALFEAQDVLETRLALGGKTVEVTIDIGNQSRLATGTIGRLPCFGALEFGPGRYHTLGPGNLLAPTTVQDPDKG